MPNHVSPRVCLIISGAIMLSACGGGSMQVTPVPTVTVGELRTKTGATVLTFNPANTRVYKDVPCPNIPNSCTQAETLSYSDDTQLVTGTPNITERDTRSGAQEGTTTVRANLGDIYAIAVADPRDQQVTFADIGSYGGIFGRISDAELPTTTTGTFTGEYKGLAIENAGKVNQQVDRAFVGDMRLDVDFATDSVTGNITGRTFETLAGSFISNSRDVTLQNGVLRPDGSFTANAFGGAIENGGGISGIGSVQGAIGGATGQKSVGLVAIQHRDMPGIGDIQEYGVFAATR